MVIEVSSFLTKLFLRKVEQGFDLFLRGMGFVTRQVFYFASPKGQNFSSCNLLYFLIFSYIGLTSSNPLLEFCLDGGFSRKDSSQRSAAAAEDSILPILTSTTSVEASRPLLPQTSLLSQCSTCSDWLSSDHPMLEAVDLHLRQTGCDINVQDVQGKTALHHLIQGMY